MNLDRHAQQVADYEAHAADRTKAFGKAHEVPKAEFFDHMGNRNVHPTPSPLWSTWRQVASGAVVGYSEPGYLSPYGTPARYFLGA